VEPSFKMVSGYDECSAILRDGRFGRGEDAPDESPPVSARSWA